jgi:type III pantothenate kinase
VTINSSASLYLVDIGHTNAKFWRDGEIERVPLDLFYPKFFSEKIFYVSVNLKYREALKNLPNWVDLEPLIEINTNYKTLGVDRKLAIYGVKNGIIVDMGSAVTVDVVKNGVHLGGYILLGKDAVISAFKEKTPHLSFGDGEPFFEKLPNSTEDALYFGFFHPIISLLKKLEEDYTLPITVTGGDSCEIREIFKDAHFKPNLLFENMEKIVERVKRKIEEQRVNPMVDLLQLAISQTL